MGYVLSVLLLLMGLFVVITVILVELNTEKENTKNGKRKVYVVNVETRL